MEANYNVDLNRDRFAFLHRRLESVLTDRIYCFLVQAVVQAFGNSDVLRHSVLINHERDFANAFQSGLPSCLGVGRFNSL